MDTSDFEKKQNQPNPGSDIYNSSREHILEELRLIDLLLYRKFLDLKTSQNDIAGQFKGLVITDNEVLRLLTGNDGNIHSSEDVSVNEDIKKDIDKKLQHYRKSIDKRLNESVKKGAYLSLPVLSGLFSLNDFEEFCLLICLGIEVDGKYEKIYSYLQDDVTKKKPTVQFVINLFTEEINQRIDARTLFREESPLLKFQLIEMLKASDTSEPLISKFIKLDDKIADYLLGINNISSKIQKFSTYISPSEIEAKLELSPELKNNVDSFTGVEIKKLEEAQKKILFSFSGPAGSGKLRLTKYICKNLNIPLLEIDCEKILEKGLDILDHLFAASRESLLLNAALCLNNLEVFLGDAKSSSNLIKSICNDALIFSPITFINSTVEFGIHNITSEKVLIEHKFDIPGVIDRKEIWSENLGHYKQILFDKEVVDDLAAKFRFTEGQISKILGNVSRKTDFKNLNINTFKQQELYDACRTNSNNEINNLASKIKANHDWDEIVLPENQMDQLRDICNYSKYHFKVYGEWGFDKKLSYGKGLNVLFTGPPGTGKTMAAEVLAKELDIDLYKIDLSQVVSKYIGETEKNLHKIFNEAQKTYSILFFDEADSLFGKRSEVKDAHDRYANIEIGYLLQKMEEYDGITILATNLKNNIDDAFIRRIQFIVEFPFPDEVYRKKIWEVIFPHQTPISEELNYEILAREIKLTGGNIKNIALSAAFFAASEKKEIEMPHIVKAARREHQKIGRTWSSSLIEDSESGLTH